MRRLLLLTLAIAALLASGCGADSESGEEGAAPEAATEEPDPQSTASDERARDEQPAKPKGTTIKLAGSPYGKVLFDRAGQAIYLFDKEQLGRSECYDECAAAWPPVLTKGDPEAGKGIDKAC